MEIVDGEDEVDAIDIFSSADFDGFDLLFTQDPAGINGEGIAIAGV